MTARSTSSAMRWLSLPWMSARCIEKWLIRLYEYCENSIISSKAVDAEVASR